VFVLLLKYRSLTEVDFADTTPIPTLFSLSHRERAGVRGEQY